MPGFSISGHACLRYIERIDGRCSIAEARDAIRDHSRAIEAALSIGCSCIRLGCGARIVLDFTERQVVTILPAQPKVKSIQRSGRGLDFGACKRITFREV